MFGRNDDIEQIIKRKKDIGQRLISNPDMSVIDLSKEFPIGKSQVLRDVNDLKDIDFELYEKCRKILLDHKDGKYRWDKRRKEK